MLAFYTNLKKTVKTSKKYFTFAYTNIKEFKSTPLKNLLKFNSLTNILTVLLFVISIAFISYYVITMQDYIIENAKDYFFCLPFLGFFIYFCTMFFLTISTFFFSVHGVHLLSSLAIFIFWVIQLFFLDKFVYESTVVFFQIDFMSLFGGDIQFSWSLSLDFISFGFLFLTTSIGVCAIVYSLTYFKNEPHADRFILLLNWFVLSMSLLVISDNSILLFLGWELIGLTSFFLINFWTTRRGTLKAALKAFVYNKISDVFLLFFITLMTSNAGTSSISGWLSYLAITDFIYPTSYSIAIFLVILGSSIKSAQFGPHTWLPDSMEAPIPASALIHSATLVSAGVYLMLRFYEFIYMANLQQFIGSWGAITACFGAIVSAAQTDCKKLLAYSTISHCGFLFVTVSLNNFSMTMLYLYLHGFFKAMTFFCIGNLVRYSAGNQDTRKMGALLLLLPVETLLLSVCAFNLGALPLTVGYMYKHFFQVFLANYPEFSFFLPFLLFGMLCSCIYVFRLVYYSTFDIVKGHKHINDYNLYTKNIKNYASNTTVLSIFFITISIFFYMYISNFYCAHLLRLDGLINNVYSVHLDAAYILNNPLASLCFLYFYGFFGVVFFIIITVECRAEITNIKKKHVGAFVIFYLTFCFFMFTFILFF